MRKEDFSAFAEMLDAVCSLLSRDSYAPSTQNTALFFRALSKYSLEDVRFALDAHVSDPVRGKFAPTPADLIAQIDAHTSDGRPGVEEAWALIPMGEDATIVWTAEMAEAYGTCSPLLLRGDTVAARMTFKEVYERSVALARHSGRAVEWSVSLGRDLEQRKRALQSAVQAGRISEQIAHEAMPSLPAPSQELARLPPPNASAKARAQAALKELATKFQGDESSNKGWAEELRRKEKAGERLTESQRLAWREALDRGSPNQPMGAFTPIPEHCLPPGMRKGSKQ
jgi:hypothetical protein